MEEENKLYVPSNIAENLPSMVKNELTKMPAQKQEEFCEEYKRKAKSVGTAYVCLILGGGFGIHYAYLGKWGLFALFMLTGGGCLIWWIIDLFRLPGVVKNHNKDNATDILRNLKAIA